MTDKNETKEVKAPKEAKPAKEAKAKGGKDSKETKEKGKSIHPTLHDVVFKDVSCDFAFLGKSTMSSKETIKWDDGKEYPIIKVEISSASHPFFTGKHRVLDTEGRIDKFRKKYGAFTPATTKK